MPVSDEATALVAYVQQAIDKGRVRPSSYTFHYHSPDRQWSCALFSLPCMVCGKQCSRTLPYCRRHLASEYKVKLAPTSLRRPDGRRYQFLGIFAVGQPGERVFVEGETMMPYLGEIGHNYDWLLERYGDSTVPYGFKHNGRQYYTDSALLRGAAASINMATPEQSNNVAFENTMPLARIYALRDIYDGEELLLDYGDSYRFGESGVVFKTSRSEESS